MLVDLTLKVTPKMVTDAQGTERKAFTGHLGTHFDVMDKEFPLEYTERKGLVFDVSSVRDRDIGTADVDVEKVMPGMFVAFCTGFIEEAGYGTAEYAHSHPQLSGGRLRHRYRRCGRQERKGTYPDGSAVRGQWGVYRGKSVQSEMRGRRMRDPHFPHEFRRYVRPAMPRRCGTEIGESG